MDYLAQLIEERCSSKNWVPVKSVRGGLAFFHLFFADDLDLFAKADRANCSTIREVLDGFCGRYGQTVSEAKSRVYFSPNVDGDVRDPFVTSWVSNLLLILENTSESLLSI